MDSLERIKIYDCLDKFYTSRNEDSRLLVRHGQVEYLTTMRYIQKYLRQATGFKLLEVGAATGRYSLALAKSGCDVTAVELIPHNLGILKAGITENMKLKAFQGNALDMNFLEDAAYDMTLVLGPLYHLFTNEDKKRVISEALRVTKPGGIVFAAYCVSDASIIDYGFKQGNIWSLVDSGLLDTERFTALSKPELCFDLFRKSDIDALMAGFPVERLHYVASDLVANQMPSVIDGMDDRTFELYMKYHFSVCERPDLVGITNHSLDIFRKVI
jgi:SAM-dependent methyltransferase